MKQEKVERYVDLGLGVVIWSDACVYFRRQSLDGYKLVKQISIGQVFYDKKQRAYIIIQNYRLDYTDHDGTVVPEMWALSFTPLAPDEKRVKELKRLADWQGGV